MHNNEPIFSKWPTLITYHAWIKDLFKMKNQPMEFNVTKHRKISDLVSHFIPQLPRSSHLSNSGVVSKIIHN